MFVKQWYAVLTEQIEELAERGKTILNTKRHLRKKDGTNRKHEIIIGIVNSTATDSRSQSLSEKRPVEYIAWKFSFFSSSIFMLKYDRIT